MNTISDRSDSFKRLKGYLVLNIQVSMLDYRENYPKECFLCVKKISNSLNIIFRKLTF